MTQDEFVAARNGDWSSLEILLDRLEGRSARAAHFQEVLDVARLARTLSGDLARAEAAAYGHDLRDHLEHLAARSHAVLHRAPPWRLREIGWLLLFGFPTAIRRCIGWFATAAVLFVVPAVFGAWAAASKPELAEFLVGTDALEQAARSYRENIERPAGGDLQMTGFYVFNNIGIAFRCFATGIFFGLGSAFFLVFNGLAIGAVFGYVTTHGGGANLLTFTSGHSAFELTAIVVSGAAGLRMGDALVRTGGWTRLASLRASLPDIVPLVLGATAMLAIAACIEGLWSASPVPAPVKHAVGVLNVVLVTAYFTLAGRAGPPRGGT